LADDGRYAIVGEPTREYLWILSRTPRLKVEDDQRIREFLAAKGYDLNRLQAHRHTLP
jgi:apolipoprotein D and lipocalin family protein